LATGIITRVSTDTNGNQVDGASISLPLLRWLFAIERKEAER
jgi:hypothetical protein